MESNPLQISDYLKWYGRILEMASLPISFFYAILYSIFSASALLVPLKHAFRFTAMTLVSNLNNQPSSCDRENLIES